MARTLWAVSDLHASVPANRARVSGIKPVAPGDWLIVAGDVAEDPAVVTATLSFLRERFAQVIWVPGNHELFSTSSDALRGRAKYSYLVEECRRMGVITPEDEFPVFAGVTIAPLFTLYDYSFRRAGQTISQALAHAASRNIMMTDEVAIAPFVDIPAWCWDRLTYSVRRLSQVQGPTVLVNHWPLVVEPTHRVRWPDIALWAGTRHTRSWPERFQAQAVVYGHLHLPGVTRVAGVPHVEVSLGYPREQEAYRQFRRTHPDRSPEHPWPYPVLTEGDK